jgi:hypothetical protein
MRRSSKRASPPVPMIITYRLDAGREEMPPRVQRPGAFARSRVWIRSDESRIEVWRLDYPYRDDAGVSAVRRYVEQLTSNF